MTNKTVMYIKENVGLDITANRRISGVDYSAVLGRILMGYLDKAQDMQAISVGAIIDIGKLERMLGAQTNKTILFPETKKCGVAIHELWEARDEQALRQIRRYAIQLAGQTSN